MLTYVDDILLTINNSPATSNLFQTLQKKFHILNLDEASHFLGIHINKTDTILLLTFKSITKICNILACTPINLYKTQSSAKNPPLLNKTAIFIILNYTFTLRVRSDTSRKYKRISLMCWNSELWTSIHCINLLTPTHPRYYQPKLTHLQRQSPTTILFCHWLDRPYHQPKSTTNTLISWCVKM